MTIRGLRLSPSPAAKPATEQEVAIEMEPLFGQSPLERQSAPDEGQQKVSSRKRATNGKNRPKQKSKYNIPNIGIIMAVGSSLMFSLCSLIVKLLSAIAAPELAVFRFIGVLIPVLPLCIKRGESPFPKGKRIMLVLRSVFGTTSLLLQFYAFQHMPLADASVIVFSAPVFVAVFARIFLKENCGMFQVCLICLTLVGVTLITRPPWLFGSLIDTYTASEWHGAIAAFCGTIVASNVYVILRVLKDVHFAVSLTTFAIIAIIITVSVTFITTTPCIPPCGRDRWMIVAIGALSYLGQILKTKALQVEEAGPVSIARTADVIFAFIWQFLFFGEVPDALTLMGAFMVTSCVLLLGIRRWVLQMPKNARFRRIFPCLTW